LSLSGPIAELREVADLLREVRGEIESVNKQFGVNTAKEAGQKALETYMTTSQAIYVVRRLVSLMRRMNLGEEADEALRRLQQLITLIRLAHTSMMLLQAGTPYGLLMGAIGGISGALYLGDMMAGY